MGLHSCRANVIINHNSVLSDKKMEVQTGVVKINEYYYEQ